MKGWVKRFNLILTTLGWLSKDLITDILGSRLFVAIGKNVGFGMFIVGTTFEKIDSIWFYHHQRG